MLSLISGFEESGPRRNGQMELNFLVNFLRGKLKILE